jgi:hypothetical protein
MSGLPVWFGTVLRSSLGYGIWCWPPGGTLVTSLAATSRSCDLAAAEVIASAYAAAIPTTGALSGLPPIEPLKAASPKLKIPPSEATIQ